jgi:hypothetical protein
MPNILAYIALFSWPIFVKWSLSRYPTKDAIFISLTLAMLLLPSGFEVDPPLIPSLDKSTLTYLSLFLFVMLQKGKFRVFLPGLTTKLILSYFMVVIFSSLLNSDPIVAGWRFLPGITWYDAFTYAVTAFLSLIPFFLGRFFSTDVKDTERFYKFWVMAALIYSLPMLLEIRISPQLQAIVYGFNAGDFLQQIRAGGYRPMVFYGHGLGLAFWLATSVVAVAALRQSRIKIFGFSTLFILFYILFVLVLSKTWSAIFYSLLSVVFIFYLSPLKQVKYAFLLAALVMLYPVAKLTGVLPEKQIINVIEGKSSDRAQSLSFRFENENLLLGHALERPFFGWSGYGRSRLYDDYGKDMTVIDGAWVGEMSAHGFMGFFFYYAILLTPLYYARKAVGLIKDKKDQAYFASLSVLLLICILDSIPNTGMRSMHWFLAGALLGQSEFLISQRKRRVI